MLSGKIGDLEGSRKVEVEKRTDILGFRYQENKILIHSNLVGF